MVELKTLLGKIKAKLTDDFKEVKEAIAKLEDKLDKETVTEDTKDEYKIKRETTETQAVDILTKALNKFKQDLDSNDDSKITEETGAHDANNDESGVQDTFRTTNSNDNKESGKSDNNTEILNLIYIVLIKHATKNNKSDDVAALLTEFNLTVGELNKDKDESVEKLEEVNEKFSNLSSEVENLKTDKEKAEEEKTRLEKELKTAKEKAEEEKTKLKGQVETAKKEKTELKGQVETAKKEKKELEAKLKTAEAENTKLREELEKAIIMDDINTLVQDFLEVRGKDERNKKIQSLSKKNERLAKLLSQYEESNEKMIDGVINLFPLSKNGREKVKKIVNNSKYQNNELNHSLTEIESVIDEEKTNKKVSKDSKQGGNEDGVEKMEEVDNGSGQPGSNASNGNDQSGDTSTGDGDATGSGQSGQTQPARGFEGNGKYILMAFGVVAIIGFIVYSRSDDSSNSDDKSEVIAVEEKKVAEITV